MSRTFFFAGLALATAACPAIANHSPQDLAITLRLSDDSFCPGGKMWGPEGRLEGRDDRVSARVLLRAADVRRTGLRNSRGLLVVRDARGQEHFRREFRVSGSFDRRARTVQNIRFRPPQRPGTYRISVRLGSRSLKDSARFTVAHDPKACPRTLRPRPPVVARPPIPVPPHRPVRNMADYLRVQMQVAYSCQPGTDRARVTVVNTHPRRSLTVRGLASHGLEGLGAFYPVGWTPGLLRPGQSLTFEAVGKLKAGDRRAVAYILNHPSARAGQRVSVRCRPRRFQPGYGDLFHQD